MHRRDQEKAGPGWEDGHLEVMPSSVNSTSSNSIALLIDADNSPAAKIDFIISELAGHGVVNIRRAYGNWKKPTLAGWEKVLNPNSIQAMQSFDLVKGKNATDMSLVIDAMDILYTKNVTTFCLVSSDCDFTPLIQRLRADGKEVYGFGGKNTPGPFIASCTRFIYLEEPAFAEHVTSKPKSGTEKASVPVPKVKSGKELKGDTALMNRLRNAVSESENEGSGGWSPLSLVATRLANSGSTNHRSYGFKKLSDLFGAIDLFEMKQEKRKETLGALVWVKLKKAKATANRSGGSMG